MREQESVELKVGLFISIGVGLIMLAVVLLGGVESFFASRSEYVTYFDSADGLIKGAKVVLGGIKVGLVRSVEMDSEAEKILVRILVDSEFEKWIRKDSLVEISTQGVLGDKYISVSAGSLNEPILSSGSEIPTKGSQGISHFISEGEQLLISLNSIAGSLERLLGTFEKNDRHKMFFEGMALSAQNLASISQKVNQQLTDIEMNQAVSNLNNILKKIDRGKGSLGALINDSQLYDDVKSLVGGANRNRIMRNLVRKTIKENEDTEISDGQSSN